MIDYKQLIDDWFARVKNKNTSYIDPFYFKELLKQKGLHKKFPPDFAIFNVLNNKIECTNKPEIRLANERAVVYEKYFQKLIDNYNISFKDNSCFIFDLASACPSRKILDEIDNLVISTHIPNSEKTQVIPFSDCHYLHPHFKEIYQSKIKFSEKTWEEKNNKLVWRGNSNPTLRPEENMYDESLYPISGNSQWCFIRLELCSKYFNHKNMNLGIHEVTDEEWKKPYIPYLREVMSPLKMSEYKYILDVCGIGATCDATIWKLQSGSLLIWLVDNFFYKKDEPLWLAWYTPLLKPYEHYIPANLDNLNDQFNWCEDNQQKCKEIAHNAKKIIKDILNIWETANAYILENISKLGAN
jgi:hypothetical protein